MRTQHPQLLKSLLSLGPLLWGQVAVLEDVLKAGNLVVDGLQLLSQGIAESSHGGLP
jgi:hypothetical protein